MNELQWCELVEKTRNGDKNAFEKLYRETERSVYFTALKLLANEDTAKDVMQDTFMTAIQKLDTLDDGAKFPKWVNMIAVNKCKQYFRKPAEDSLDEQTEQGFDLSDDDSFIPEEYVTNETKRKLIMQIINDVLSDVQRQTIIMYYYDEMSLEEIAQVMECPIKTVSSRLCSAREKIKEAVLIYEEQNNDRLHVLIPVPILTEILRKEAASISIPDISQVLIGSQLFSAAVNASANTVTASTAVAGGSTMVGGILTGKVITAIAAGVIAVGGTTTAIVMSANSSDDSSAKSTSVVVTDITASSSSSVLLPDSSSINEAVSSKTDSSEQDSSSDQDSSSQTDISSKTDSSSSRTDTKTDEKYVEWKVEDVSALIESSIRGKPIAEAEQVINEKLGTDPAKWTAKDSGKYTVYEQELETGIKIYNTIFTKISISELKSSKTVDAKGGSVTFYRYYKDKGAAEVAEAWFVKGIQADGYKGDMTTFANRWILNNGKLAHGAGTFKTYRGQFLISFYPKD